MAIYYQIQVNHGNAREPDWRPHSTSKPYTSAYPAHRRVGSLMKKFPRSAYRVHKILTGEHDQ